MRLSFDKGKYEVIFDEHTGTLEALRYGQPWRNLTGDNLILSMAQEVEALRAAAPAKQPPYANMDEHLADLEAHASPAKEATREGETPISDSNIIRYSNAKSDESPFEYIPLHVGRTLEQRAESAERRAADAEASLQASRGFRDECERQLQEQFTLTGIEEERARAAESERDALREKAQAVVQAWEYDESGQVGGALIEALNQALAPAVETTTPAEPKDFAQVEDIARASLASLYSCMDHSVLPHVRKKIEDYISLLKRQASL